MAGLVTLNMRLFVGWVLIIVCDVYGGVVINPYEVGGRVGYLPM